MVATTKPIKYLCLSLALSTASLVTTTCTTTLNPLHPQPTPKSIQPVATEQPQLVDLSPEERQEAFIKRMVN